jgi:hypothetical protein
LAIISFVVSGGGGIVLLLSPNNYEKEIRMIEEFVELTSRIRVVCR